MWQNSERSDVFKRVSIQINMNKLNDVRLFKVFT
jgi:hypothetical protein